jgi:hypothetical protein
MTDVDVALLLGTAFMSLMLLRALIIGLQEARMRYHDCAGRGEAEKKARDLLKQWLSPAQLAQYEGDGYFEVTGCDTGKRYRVRRDRQMNIDELDRRDVRIAVWCFGPEGHLPLGDVMLAQKLALETDEQAALAIANRNSGTYPGSNWSQSSRAASDDCLCCFNHDPGSGNLESISRTTGAV